MVKRCSFSALTGFFRLTLIRFFTIHFLLPFVMSLLAVLHITFLHWKGSKSQYVTFHPLFTSKDLIGTVTLALIFSIVIGYWPHLLLDHLNFTPTNAMSARNEIKPEWYFLPWYAILRAIPNKTLGVISLMHIILLLFLFPRYNQSKQLSRRLPLLNFRLLCILSVFKDFIIFGFYGCSPIEEPFLSFAR